MIWAETVPNLLIGLREGLEAGLLVSILLAAVRKAAQTAPHGRGASTVPVWLGVAAAVAAAGSFAAVLTFTTNELSSRTQEAVSGLLSVLAVALVTGMVFWMRRTAATLSAHLRGDVSRALTIGAGALTITAFLAIGREALETTLFIWAAVKASGSTLAPMTGAVLGLAAAILLCWLLYRQAMRLNLAKFFNLTAVGLIVVAAGILSYGIGDLQSAGWLPGTSWVAFDLSTHVDPNSWWASLITGITALSAKMAVLQVAVWAVYLLVVIALFVRAGQVAPALLGATPEHKRAASRWEQLVAAHMWPVAAALVLVPVAIAALVIALVPAPPSGSTTAVSVTDSDCAREWHSAPPGVHTFTVDNKTRKPGEITLTDPAGAVLAEIEVLGPATTAPMTAVLANGSYTLRCYLAGQPATASEPVRVTGRPDQAATAAVSPVTADDLAAPNRQYQDAARAALDTLQRDVAVIRTDLAANNIGAAKHDWLTAQQDWERVGASYDSFGDKGRAVDGLPGGLPGGVSDAQFTGLHRLEYGLFAGQSPAALQPVVNTLATDVASVMANLSSDGLAGNATNLPIRAHEILEDAQRDHLSGIDDLGGGAAYPQTAADVDITRTVLADLAPLITPRAPQLVPAANGKLDALAAALRSTQVGGQWQPPSRVPPAARQQVNAALGAALETLAAVPDLLEVPKNQQ